MNLSTTETDSIDVSSLGVEVVGDLSVKNHPYNNGNKIVMPPLSMLLLH